MTVLLRVQINETGLHIFPWNHFLSCFFFSFWSNVQRFSTSSPIWNVISHLEKRSPKNPEQKIIKRVIALEGDIVRTIGHKNRLVKVPRGHMWVEGDHHGHSFDSNSFGPVSLGLLHAHATHILWPPERWQRLESVLPPERCPLQTGEK
ncbi:mitochondrial inner membrane protease subunit 2 isoform X1 [Mus musculus]|uniref:mitochondrial inner membrane protease subunit 2 isoform X1 n=1 Tax=Mus musculus TaxID=10090 RepID=UPI0007EC2F07|nr:mitochondrial inner membrane protease subunit 2 isoform X1 [Mus musculus]|eukprot:XP_017170750.1 PREDICTED: mitochondrial inner membrane protease subunit 2 isoform X1 [Mus musculus]